MFADENEESLAFILKEFGILNYCYYSGMLVQWQSTMWIANIMLFKYKPILWIFFESFFRCGKNGFAGKESGCIIKGNAIFKKKKRIRAFILNEQHNKNVPEKAVHISICHFILIALYSYSILRFLSLVTAFSRIQK